MIQTIGEAIKCSRIKSNMTQLQLCGNFMDRTLLSKIENGKLIPTIKELEYISEKLNIPISFFLDNRLSNCRSDESIIGDSILSQMYNNNDYHGIIKNFEFNIKEEAFQTMNSNLYYYLGMSYYNLKLINKSLIQLRKYITLYMKDSEINKKNNVINFATALNTLFKIMLENKNYIKGEHYLHMAIKYLSEYKSESTLINYIVHSNLGYIYISINKYNEAIRLLENFLSRNNDFIYVKIMPDIHNCLSIAYYNLGNYSMAIDHVKKCIFFYSYIGSKNQSSACYINYLNALRYSKNYTKAIEVLGKVKTEIEENFQLYQRFLMQEIIINFDIGNYDYIYSKISLISTRNLKKSSLMDYYYIKGHIEFLRNNYSEALFCYKKCKKYFSDYKFYFDLSLIYEDVYTITHDEEYMTLKNNLDGEIGRKNILVP